MTSRIWKAWVPTVLGNLSFSLVGRYGRPFPFFIYQQGSADAGMIVTQRRIPPDAKIPILCFLPSSIYLRLTEWLLANLKKEYYFSLYLIYFKGEKDPQTQSIQDISGEVIGFTRKCLKEFITINRKLSSNEISYQELVDHIKELKGQYDHISGSFCLDRQGFCDLKEVGYFRDGLIKQQEDPEYQQKIANQLYYFVRDVFHTHKHHDSYEEALIQAHNFDSSNPCRWTDRLLKDIMRHLIRNREEAGYRIMGVFPYLLTLCSLLNDLCSSEQKKYLHERLISLEGLKSSIEAGLKDRQSNTERWRWMVGVSLGVVGILVAFSYGIDGTIKDFLSHHKLWFFVIATLGLIIILIFDKVRDAPLLTSLDYCIGEKILSVKNRFLASGMILILIGIFLYGSYKLFGNIGMF